MPNGIQNRGGLLHTSFHSQASLPKSKPWRVPNGLALGESILLRKKLLTFNRNQLPSIHQTTPMRFLKALATILASTPLTACGNSGQINAALSGTPKALRDCNELALEVLIASYEKAGDNQGRLISFSSPTKLNRVDGGTTWYDMEKFTLDSDGNIQKTTGTAPIFFAEKTNVLDDASDYRIMSKAGDSITCGIYFSAEGNVSSNIYTISRDSGSIYWRES